MMASTRIIVRIVSVALLSLTLLAGSASAECAWILWVLGSGQTQFFAVEGFETRAQCDQMRVAKLADAASRGEKHVLMQCFPDTFDPRK